MFQLMQHKDNPGEALWVMVDSDGEEDEESSGLSLRENDLVSLFNQLPIDDVFRMLLKVRRRDGQVNINYKASKEFLIISSFVNS